MGRLLLAFSFLLASASLAATDTEILPGTAARPGHNYTSPVYVNSTTNTTAKELKKRFGAAYAAVNSQITDQAIIVEPRIGFSSPVVVNDGNIESIARNFLASSALMLSAIQLEVQSKRFVMGKAWFIHFRKSWDGIPIDDGGIGLAINSNGQVNILWGNLNLEKPDYGNFSVNSDMALEVARRGLTGNVVETKFLGKYIMPICFDNSVEYHPAYKYMVITQDPYCEWEAYVDAGNGNLIQREDKVYHYIVSGNASGSIQPGYPTNPWSDTSFFDMDLTFDGYDPVTTDSSGNYSLDIASPNPLNVNVYLSGPFLHVSNSAGPSAEIIESVTPPTTYNVHWDDSNSLGPERDAYFSGVRVHKWITKLDPGLGVMDFPMFCYVNVAGSCNAFYSGYSRTINFYSAGGGCPNMAQIADVVWHEYGHGVTDLQTRPIGPNGAMHEGFSDYLACTIMNQPLVGIGFFLNQPNAPLRNIDNNNRWPDDTTGESHNDGLIISGALWHTRQALSPYPMGYVDTLWHFARYAQAQDFETYFWSFVELDDNDGDISNGTPNAHTIFHTFGDLHGIGPGTSLSLAANSILDTEDTTQTFTISATISSFFDLLPDSVLLYYDNGSGYQPISMTFNNSAWTGVIPAQRNGTHVNYYVLAVDRAGFRGTAPAGAPGNSYTFYVGPDAIPPTLAFIEGPPNTVSLYGPYGPFAITAQDINGINPSFVKLHYFINTESESQVNLSPDTGAVFRLALLDLSRHLFTGDTVHYYFTALDGAHIPNSGRLPANGSYSLVMVTSEVFENFDVFGIDRWIADEGWVLRNDGYISPHSIWFASPNYPNNANASITMNYDFDLSAYRSAHVTFMRKNLLRTGDTCFVEATNNDGSHWTRVGAITGLVAPMYQLMSLDISPILDPSSHHYKIRFRFVSDSDSTWIGVIIDNIGWSVDPVLDGIEDVEQLPKTMELSQNYPNPFNPETNIMFTLPLKSSVRLEIFDILGRQISTLLNKEMMPGEYSVIWDGKDKSDNAVASGVYFYRLTTDNGTKQQKMTLLR